MSDAHDHSSGAEAVTDTSDARDAAPTSADAESGHDRTSAPAGRSGRLRRWAGAAGAVAMVAGSTVAFAPAAAAVVAPPPAENAAARAAVAELTSDQPWAATIPSDFPQREGYSPVVDHGLMVNPSGDCSSPISLPADFDDACKAHDLGYDLLRYANGSQQPLGPWARQAIDGALAQRLYGACATRPDSLVRARCEVMAGAATTAVDLNSRRQNYASPVPEYVFGTELSGSGLGAQLGHAAGPAAGVVVALTAVVVGFRRLRRRALARAAASAA